jgi:hypothetical protein
MRALEQRRMKLSGEEFVGARSVGRRWREVKDEVVRRGERVKVTVWMGYL